MTAPICHGREGGCFEDVHGSEFWWHAPTCPALARPPAKRTMGQCSEECGHARSVEMGAQPSRHIAACPALYPLQRQPGDEKDALTRLTAMIRERLTGGAVDDFLDLISEAREEHRHQRNAVRHANEVCLDSLEATRTDLARAKALVTTITGQQSEVRQQAFRDMAAEMEHMSSEARERHLQAILGVERREP